MQEFARKAFETVKREDEMINEQIATHSEARI